MAKVMLTNDLGRRFAGGDTELELDVKSVRELLRRLDEKYPGISDVIQRENAIAIDDEILHDALYAPIGPDSEIFFVRALRGG